MSTTPPPAHPPTAGDLNEALLQAPVWTDEMVAEAGIPVVDRPVVTFGGGIGSLFVVNLLRTAGMATHQIAVLSGNRYPHETYEFLASNSQIPRHERLRSDSAAMPDNVWGFPSYALREARGGRLGALWQVLTEPVIAEYFTPRSGDVYEGIVREADRIGWEHMLARGQVRMVRRRHGGGYFTILTPPRQPDQPRRVAYRSRFVHIAIGYPGARFLPDLQEYRESTGDHVRVVNAYEPHEHVYTQLMRRPGRVLLRGSGIVGSRILQRLFDDREAGRSQTEVVHLFRSYIQDDAGAPRPKRRAYLGFSYQPFNLPKSCFGGHLADVLESIDDPQRRAELLRVWAGTTTAWRSPWITQLERNLATGAYRQATGEVLSVARRGEQLVVVVRDPAGTTYELAVDYIIDGTGLQGEVTDHRVLRDLIEVGGVGRNAMGRLDVDRSFELIGARQPPGRVFASGTMTLGGYYAAVDSFLGLEFAAWRIVDAMAADGLCRRIGSGRSISQWFRRMRGAPP